MIQHDYGKALKKVCLFLILYHIKQISYDFLTDKLMIFIHIMIDDFYLYWSIVNGLLPSNRMYIRHIPAKLYLPVSNNVLQAPINLLNERGKLLLKT